ncbi:hypothetical protein [Agrilutibacter solisilvae]|uniref:Uncharacterized protein n=1 Tax=Agrilutibacter solisilvae TaxID=2763317 RepID=A0A974Y6K6_9GAMM|nr:hypothetical protein [Lysobacter solisilvae]QSX79756.1 hypothetical protein I8J32_007960 [Lysobacter solisilvae]
MSDNDPYEHPGAPTPPGKPVRIGPLGWTVIGLLVLAANAWLWPRMLGFL